MRSPAAPEVPTAAEAGFPDLTFQGTLAFFGPRGMPTALRERIAARVRAVATHPGFAERLGPLGMCRRRHAGGLADAGGKETAYWAERRLAPARKRRAAGELNLHARFRTGPSAEPRSCAESEPGRGAVRTASKRREDRADILALVVRSAQMAPPYAP